MGKKEVILEKHINGASENDIIEIGERLNSMNKGQIKDIWNKVQALLAMIKDPEAAWHSKAMAIGTLIYLISPIDAIPDIIPAFGLSDDFALIIATVASLASSLKKYIDIQNEKNLLNFEMQTRLMQENSTLLIKVEKYKTHRAILGITTVIGVAASIILLIFK